MQKTTLTLSLTVSQVRDAAMRAAGVDPRLVAIKPGTRVQRDRKHLLKRGYVKHKAHCLD